MAQNAASKVTIINYGHHTVTVNVSVYDKESGALKVRRRMHIEPGPKSMTVVDKKIWEEAKKKKYIKALLERGLDGGIQVSKGADADGVEDVTPGKKKAS